jgi:hypothetical protein
MSLAACRLGHQILVRHEAHVLYILNLVYVHWLLHLDKVIAILLNVTPSKSNSTFQLLLHLFEIYKFALSELALA